MGGLHPSIQVRLQNNAGHIMTTTVSNDEMSNDVPASPLPVSVRYLLKNLKQTSLFCLKHWIHMSGSMSLLVTSLRINPEASPCQGKLIQPLKGWESLGSYSRCWTMYNVLWSLPCNLCPIAVLRLITILWPYKVLGKCAFHLAFNFLGPMHAIFDTHVYNFM